jgi:SPP1 gp7 family putative phage head morphogenesis protein
MLQSLLKKKGIRRNITFRPIDISAGGEDSFNRIFSGAIDYAMQAISEASIRIEHERDLLPVFKSIKAQCLAHCGRLSPKIANILAKEASLHGAKLATNIKSKTGVDVAVLLHGMSQDMTAIVSQAQASLETVISDFIDEYQHAVLDFRAIGYVRDEQLTDFETSSQQLKRLARNKQARARAAAKRAARNNLGNANAKNAKKANESLGLELYVWRTMLDDKVRASHEEREGVIYNWSDPPNGGHPSEDWGCRCIAAPFYKGADSATDRQAFKCF